MSVPEIPNVPDFMEGDTNQPEEDWDERREDYDDEEEEEEE